MTDKNQRAHEALGALISEISYRKLLYSLGGEEWREEIYKELEEKALLMTRLWNKYDVVKVLRTVLNNDFIDDAVKLKFIRLAAAVSE